MKGIDIIQELSDSERIAVEGDVGEQYQNNWWDKMVRDADGYINVEAYLYHRETCDDAVANKLLAAGVDEKELKTKAGRIKFSGIFKNKKAYSNYRSNKSIIAGCLDGGISLTENGEPRPKSVLQKALKDQRDKSGGDTLTPFGRAIVMARKLAKVMPELSLEESEAIKKVINGDL